MTDYRPLTKREQLEWMLKFLLEQKQKIEQEIESTEIELKLERKKENEL